MADPPLGPDTFSTRDLPTARRGYEKKAVEALIAEAVEQWAALDRRYRDLMKDVAESGGADALARDVEAVGAEVAKILEVAKAAAQGMRTRAHDDAQRVEAESAAETAGRLQAAADEAAGIVAQAEMQAFELRRDAWDSGAALIASALETGEEIIEQAGEQALSIRADAERDAHQRLALTRRESDDVIRNARYEADRLLNQARTLAQTIIDRASGSAGEDSDPAVPVARDQRIEEVERLHAERSIEGVAVLPAEPRSTSAEVAFGALDPQASDLSDALAAEVEQLNDTPIPLSRPAAARSDDVGTLFEALRTTAEHDPIDSALPRDPIALRDRLVLPVHNEGLRDVKRRIVDLQSEAVAGLQGAAGWSPDRNRITGELAAALETAIQKAGAAGSSGAEVIAGVQRVRSRPGTRPGELIGAMAQDLTSQLSTAARSDGGPSEVAAIVSRVFRAWRGDEAERWVRMVVFAAYHDSFLAAVAVGGWSEVEGRPSGRSCERCAGSDRLRWDPGSGPPEGYLVPPANLDCVCSVTVGD
jgi:hypothetical protein